MGNKKKFSEFRRFARTDARISSARSSARSQIEIRKWDSDFDVADAICETVDEMVIEYLASYHEWSNRQDS